MFQERLESLVFGLLRQRKLDFVDIYSDEMIAAAKAVVAQVRLLTPTASTRTRVKFISDVMTNPVNVWCLCLQCVAESVVHIEEIDTEVVTK